MRMRMRMSAESEGCAVYSHAGGVVHGATPAAATPEAVDDVTTPVEGVVASSSSSSPSGGGAAKSEA